MTAREELNNIIELGVASQIKGAVSGAASGISSRFKSVIEAIRARNVIAVQAARNGMNADAVREAVRTAPAAVGIAVPAAVRTGARQTGRYVRGFVTGDAGTKATASDVLKEGMSGVGDWFKKGGGNPRLVRDVGIGGGALLAGAGVYRASGAQDRRNNRDNKFRDRVYRDALMAHRAKQKQIAMSARDELKDIIEFQTIRQITNEPSGRGNVYTDGSNLYARARDMDERRRAELKNYPHLRRGKYIQIVKRDGTVAYESRNTAVVGGGVVGAGLGGLGGMIAGAASRGRPALGGVAGAGIGAIAGALHGKHRELAQDKDKRRMITAARSASFSARAELDEIMFASIPVGMRDLGRLTGPGAAVLGLGGAAIGTGSYFAGRHVGQKRGERKERIRQFARALAANPAYREAYMKSVAEKAAKRTA
jgi:hypothetical protein